MSQMPFTGTEEAPAGTAALSPPWWVVWGDRVDKGRRLEVGVVQDKLWFI